MIQANNFIHIMLLHFSSYTQMYKKKIDHVSLKLYFYLYVPYLDEGTHYWLSVVQANLEVIIKSSIFPPFYALLVMNSIFSWNSLQFLCKLHCYFYCLSSIYNLSQMGFSRKQNETAILCKRLLGSVLEIVTCQREEMVVIVKSAPLFLTQGSQTNVFQWQEHSALQSSST